MNENKKQPHTPIVTCTQNGKMMRKMTVMHTQKSVDGEIIKQKFH